MLNLLPNLQGCEGKHVTASQALPASPPLFWPPPTPTQLVESLPPTHCLSCSVSVFVMLSPLSAFSSLFHSSGTWPGQLSALQASQSHGLCSPRCFAFPSFLPPTFGTTSPAFSGPILFSPSSTLFPFKIDVILCLLLSPLLSLHIFHTS